MRKLLLLIVITMTMSLYAIHPTWESSESIQELCDAWGLFVEVELQESRLIITDLSEDDSDITANIATMLFLIKDEVEYYEIELKDLGIDDIFFVWKNTVRIIPYNMIKDYLLLEKDRDKLQFAKEVISKLSLTQLLQERQ